MAPYGMAPTSLISNGCVSSRCSEVVLADGTIVRPTRRRTRKNSTGYDLTHLCMGQELKKKGVCPRMSKVQAALWGMCLYDPHSP